jgi:hypothetical protein
MHWFEKFLQYPALHVQPQLLQVHQGVEFATAGHTWPQLAQFLTSKARSEHVPLHVT